MIQLEDSVSLLTEALDEEGNALVAQKDTCLTVEGHWSGVRGCIQLQNGLICSASHDKTLRIFLDPRRKDVDFHPEQILRGHLSSVYAVIQLQDGRICSAGEDKSIKLWNPDTLWTVGQCAKTMRNHTQAVTALVQLSDGRLFSASEDKTCKVWDLASYSCAGTCAGHGKAVLGVCQLSNSHLCSASADMMIKIWHPHSYSVLETLSLGGHTGPVNCVLQLSDGRIASCSSDATIKLWNHTKARCEDTFMGHWTAIYRLIQLQDGRLASCGDDNVVKVWDVVTFKKKNIATPDDHCLLTLHGHKSRVWDVTQLQDGRLCSASQDNTIKIWDFDVTSLAALPLQALRA